MPMKFSNAPKKRLADPELSFVTDSRLRSSQAIPPSFLPLQSV